MARKFNILYVDDEPDNLLAFRSVFRRFYNVYTASGGNEAIEFLKDRSIDLVLSDQRMPKMTGVELLSWVSQTYPSIKCMIVTGYSEMEPILDAVQQGDVDHFITKPWKVDDLRQLFEDTLTEPN